ncbi:SsrA-binding protein SmpB [Candidatus Uhrbacteria bacterium]|nr:SsrA-binding protein SmpB [Candidatus Uhrbacteria bacterium]
MSDLSVNKTAYLDFEILEEYEAGLVLTGAEVKSVRAKQMKLQGAFVHVRRGELCLKNAHISPYKPADGEQDPIRERKLLLHQNEILRLAAKKQQDRLTIVPISVYSKGPFIKIKIGLGRGKKAFEKRDTLKKKEINRTLRERMKGSVRDE